MSTDSYRDQAVSQVPVVEVRDVVTEQPVAPVVVAAPVRRTTAWRSFSPAAVAGTVLAIALIVLGAVALIRAGTDGPMDKPVVDVAGFTHTALLGFVELGAGIVLLFTSLSRDRGAIIFVSVLIATAALIAAIEPTVLSMAIERSFAIVIVIAAGVVALLAALAPSMWRTTERVEAI